MYWDQWEDGGYDADIANPGANVYANPGNLDGTQIWGDGVLANGCPPSIANVPNPCTLASDDLLQAGDVIVLDNDVIVTGTSGSYARNAAQIFYDGRDKFGVTFPAAVTRAAFPVSPGSVMAGANEVLDTGRWGTSYRAPVGENLLGHAHTRPSRTYAGSSLPASAARPSMWTRTPMATSWMPTISTVLSWPRAPSDP